jgi:Uma2 family endonuclease
MSTISSVSELEDLREPQVGEAMTADEFLRLPKFAHKYELISGVVKMSPASLKHDNIAAKLIMRIGLYLEQNPIGQFYASSVGFRLGENYVVSPDASFVRSDRLPGGDNPETYGDFAPDLAVEVISPNDRDADTEEKVQLYLTHGTRLIWVIYPRLRTTTIYRINGVITRIQAEGVLDGEDVLPGFKCKLSDIL